MTHKVLIYGYLGVAAWCYVAWSSAAQGLTSATGPSLFAALTWPLQLLSGAPPPWQNLSFSPAPPNYIPAATT